MQTMVAAERLAVYALGIALGYGALSQGAFYADQFITVMLALVVAGGAQIARKQFPESKPVRIAIYSFASLIPCSLIAAIHAGDASNAFPQIALVACVITTIVVCTTLSPEGKQTMTAIILGIGAIVAISCWVGVAFHYSPFALPSQGLWRSASTLTYANAAAAFLAAPLLLGLQLIVGLQQISRRPNLAISTVTWVLAVGWMSTISRAGFLAFFIGFVVFAALSPTRRSLTNALPVTIVTIVTTVALVPSLPENNPAHFSIALLGVAGGWLVLVMASRWTRAALACTAGILLVGVCGAWSAGLLQEATGQIVKTRLDASSSDRSDLTRITWNQFHDNPLFGVGPGNINFVFTSSSGESVSAEFTHNEYLQLAAETGILGVLPLFSGLCFLAWSAVRNVRNKCLTTRSAAVVAILITFTIHSYFDFLWHIPAVILFVSATASILSEYTNKINTFDPRAQALRSPERKLLES